MFRYTRPQILLHWAVVALLLMQYLFNEAMGQSWRAWARDGVVQVTTGTWLHIIVGATILILVLWRIALRFSSPPAPPATTLAERVGGVVHWALYAVLILTPLSGSVAWFGGQEGAAEAHETLTSALLALAALHVAGALYHQFVVKDGLMSRMSPH